MDPSGTLFGISLGKIGLGSLFKFFSSNNNNLAVTTKLRDFICYHQGQVIEHIYWGAEIHKALRIALDKKDLGTISQHLNQIDNDLPELFQHAWQMTVKQLLSLFEISHESPILPRMCIKATTTTQEGQHIEDLFREDGGVSTLSYKVPENTGFKSVQDDGKYYKCNNIPNACARSNYINPRLNPILAKKYKCTIFNKAINKLRGRNFDEAWVQCWDDYSAEKENGASCYKSTLIIPMTLMNNMQSSKFIQNTMIGVSKNARSIYGFLCFDHIEPEYFNDDDVNIGYIAADILSFYMVNELNYTTYSKTYRRAKEKVNNHVST